jgi:outer membrane protein OmpA-like peptidoglycan-associated protein
VRSLGLAVTTALVLGASTAAAQQQAPGAVERFQPSPSGDAFFGVAGPTVGGHLVPRVTAIFDYADKPLSIQDGPVKAAIVSHQAYLHLDASFALWDRLLISADMPFELTEGGDSPTVAGATFPSPTGAHVGDLRLGLRGRLLGDYYDPFQLSVSAYLYAPTAPAGSYAGDQAVRGEPQILLGGRFTHFVYSASLGTTVRASSHPSSFDAGAGAALVLGDDEFFQVGPELTIAAPFTKDRSFSTPTANIALATSTAAELLLGAKLRPLRSLVVGAGAGPGLTQGYGTPKWFAVASVGYEPLPDRTKADRDHDGIPDDEDACPDVPGVRSDDPKKNGCPPDRDGDGIPDAEDACPDVPGVHSADPKKNGCPADRDGDGIPDAEDACPDVPGERNADPKKNGCPPDRDNDGIPDAVDACPDTPGSADPDPKKNGCPHVTVTPTEIVISSEVHFKFGKSSLDQTVDPVSDSLLNEVKGAIDSHPEIEHIEVQGHTDNIGPDDFNQKLSQARAEAVRKWLVDHGVPSKKLTAVGYGPRRPLQTNATEAGRQANRRVQFLIIKISP